MTQIFANGCGGGGCSTHNRESPRGRSLTTFTFSKNCLSLFSIVTNWIQTISSFFLPTSVPSSLLPFLPDLPYLMKQTFILHTGFICYLRLWFWPYIDDKLLSLKRNLGHSEKGTTWTVLSARQPKFDSEFLFCLIGYRSVLFLKNPVCLNWNHKHYGM
jgi:hypothetical protein